MSVAEVDVRLARTKFAELEQVKEAMVRGDVWGETQGSCCGEEIADVEADASRLREDWTMRADEFF